MNNQIQKLLASKNSDPVEALAQYASDITGVQLGPKQRIMVETRLRKRMIDLSLKTFDEYFSYFSANAETETQNLISILTTHHTFFFREFLHFEYIAQVLPELLKEIEKRPNPVLKVWSAACSRGQEVYSLAMFFDHHFKRLGTKATYKILGTDVDTDSVKVSANGVYLRDEIKTVPLNFLANHWSKGTSEIANFVKVKDSLKNHCEFKTLNLQTFKVSETGAPFDLIFCRNVFIYFTPEQIKIISQHLTESLSSIGLLFVGLSETLPRADLKLSSPSPSVYQKISEKRAQPQSAPGPQTRPTTPNVAPIKEPAPTLSVAPAILKVLCVDDSISILTLLKRALTPQTGFEVIATARHGLEAKELLKTIKPDVMTLDIHMPEQDGIEYLRQSFGANHPAVVMVSSANRDEGNLAIQALELGASDFVEKPTLHNFEKSGEELRAKLKQAYQLRSSTKTSSGLKTVSSLDKSFQQKLQIQDPEHHLRIIVAPTSQSLKIKPILREVTARDKSPSLIVFWEGKPEDIKKANSDLGLTEMISTTQCTSVKFGLKLGGSFSQFFQSIFSITSGRTLSVFVMAEISALAAGKLKTVPSGSQILVEDFGLDTPPIHGMTDQVPFTSYPYMSDQYFFTKSNHKKEKAA